MELIFLFMERVRENDRKLNARNRVVTETITIIVICDVCIQLCYKLLMCLWYIRNFYCLFVDKRQSAGKNVAAQDRSRQFI